MLNWPTAAVLITALIIGHGAFIRYLSYRAAMRNSEP